MRPQVGAGDASSVASPPLWPQSAKPAAEVGRAISAADPAVSPGPCRWRWRDERGGHSEVPPLVPVTRVGWRALGPRGAGSSSGAVSSAKSAADCPGRCHRTREKGGQGKAAKGPGGAMSAAGDPLRRHVRARPSACGGGGGPLVAVVRLSQRPPWGSFPSRRGRSVGKVPPKRGPPPPIPKAKPAGTAAPPLRGSVRERSKFCSAPPGQGRRGGEVPPAAGCGRAFSLRLPRRSPPVLTAPGGGGGGVPPWERTGPAAAEGRPAQAVPSSAAAVDSSAFGHGAPSCSPCSNGEPSEACGGRRASGARRPVVKR